MARNKMWNIVNTVIGACRHINLDLLDKLNQAIQKCMSMAASDQDFQELERLYLEIPEHLRA